MKKFYSLSLVIALFIVGCSSEAIETENGVDQAQDFVSSLENVISANEFETDLKSFELMESDNETLSFVEDKQSFLTTDMLDAINRGQESFIEITFDIGRSRGITVCCSKSRSKGCTTCNGGSGSVSTCVSGAIKKCSGNKRNKMIYNPKKRSFIIY